MTSSTTTTNTVDQLLSEWQSADLTCRTFPHSNEIWNEANGRRHAAGQQLFHLGIYDPTAELYAQSQTRIREPRATYGGRVLTEAEIQELNALLQLDPFQEFSPDQEAYLAALPRTEPDPMDEELSDWEPDWDAIHRSMA